MLPAHAPEISEFSVWTAKISAKSSRGRDGWRGGVPFRDYTCLILRSPLIHEKGHDTGGSSQVSRETRLATRRITRCHELGLGRTGVGETKAITVEGS